MIFLFLGFAEYADHHPKHQNPIIEPQIFDEKENAFLSNNKKRQEIDIFSKHASKRRSEGKKFFTEDQAGKKYKSPKDFFEDNERSGKTSRNKRTTGDKKNEVDLDGPDFDLDFQLPDKKLNDEIEPPKFGKRLPDGEPDYVKLDPRGKNEKGYEKKIIQENIHEKRPIPEKKPVNPDQEVPAVDLVQNKKENSLPPGTKIVGTSIVCLDGYVSDGANNIDSRGCWKCPSECSNNEKCMHPGKCIVPVPQILKTKISKKTVSIQYSVPSGKYDPKSVFCKFQGSKPVVVSAKIVSDDHVECSIPQNDVSQVYLSFDDKSWSKEQPIVIKSGSGLTIFLVVLGIIVFGLGCFFIYKFLTKSDDSVRYMSSQSHFKTAPAGPMAYFPPAEK